jgi:hypothetical protein
LNFAIPSVAQPAAATPMSPANMSFALRISRFLLD